MSVKYTLTFLVLLWLAIVVSVLGAAGWTVPSEKSISGHTRLTRDGTLTFNLTTWLAQYSAARESVR